MRHSYLFRQSRSGWSRPAPAAARVPLSGGPGGGHDPQVRAHHPGHPGPPAPRRARRVPEAVLDSSSRWHHRCDLGVSVPGRRAL